MNKVFGILLVGLFVSALVGADGAWAGRQFKDNDWTHPFFEKCGDKGGFANGSKVFWKTEAGARFLRFSLEGGQKGNCSRDKMFRHRAPHWERSEISSGNGPNSRFQMFTGTQYIIDIKMRFVEGFTSDRETILQIYTQCNNVGGCSPALMLKSDGYGAGPSRLAAYTLFKRPTKKKQQSWSLAKRLADQYRHLVTPFRNKSGQNFAPNLHLGKWVHLKLALKIEPKEIFIKGEINDGFDSWDISSNVNMWKIDRVSGTEPPHLEIGIYRPGSNGFPNSTSTIDFDYVKIKKSDEDWNAVLERKVRATKYDRTIAGMKVRFKCLADYAAANGITDLPSEQEIGSLTTNLNGNDYYRSHRQIVKAGISQKSVNANKAALIRLVNYEGTNEEYCAKPVL